MILEFFSYFYFFHFLFHVFVECSDERNDFFFHRWTTHHYLTTNVFEYHFCLLFFFYLIFERFDIKFYRAHTVCLYPVIIAIVLLVPQIAFSVMKYL